MPVVNDLFEAVGGFTHFADVALSGCAEYGNRYVDKIGEPSSNLLAALRRGDHSPGKYQYPGCKFVHDFSTL